MAICRLNALQDVPLSVLAHGCETDKNTAHSYIDNVYEPLFTPIRRTVKTVLEIGIDRGGSLRLWRDFFPYAEIHGADILDRSPINAEPRIRTWMLDAYTAESAALLPNQLDIIIDDGPHTLESILALFEHYPQKLKAGGLLIAEDIQSIDWLSVFQNKLPPEIVRDILVYDLRSIKNRYDDLVLVWRKPAAYNQLPDYRDIPAFCVNLDYRPDRWSSVLAQFDNLAWTVTRWSAAQVTETPVPNMSTGAAGCLASHKGIWQYVINNICR